jgi:hypothetical protein
LNPTDRSHDWQTGFEKHIQLQPEERPMIRKSIFTVATAAAIGAAALIPTEASAGGGGKGGGGMGGGYHGGHHGHWGYGYGRGFGGIVVIGYSCWRWIPGFGEVYVCY